MILCVVSNKLTSNRNDTKKKRFLFNYDFDKTNEIMVKIILQTQTNAYRKLVRVIIFINKLCFT